MLFRIHALQLLMGLLPFGLHHFSGGAHLQQQNYLAEVRHLFADAGVLRSPSLFGLLFDVLSVFIQTRNLFVYLFDCKNGV